MSDIRKLKTEVANWMERLKYSWVQRDKDKALELFTKTEKYYERPFKPTTTQKEIKLYWDDIDSMDDISLDYEILAIENNVACIHWDNKYTYRNQRDHLDGVFVIKFNEQKECVEFRQWWFMEK